MKKLFIQFLITLVITPILIMGCATVKIDAANEPVYTMKTDLHAQGLTRAEYYEQMAQSYSSDNQSNKAIEHFKLSLLHNPIQISSYISLSDEYKKTNQFRLAMDELNHALKINPDHLITLKKMGDLYLETKIYSKARAIYQQMLENNHQFTEARWALFYIFKIEKKYDEALEQISQMDQTKNPEKMAYEKALVYKQLNNEDLYIANLNSAYSLNPRQRDIVLEYAKYHFSQNNYQTSTSALMNYTQTQEFDMEISQNLSFSAVQAGQYETALQEYNKQRNLTYDVALIDLKKAHIYYLMNDLVSAEKIYLSLLVYDQNDEARYYLAQIYIAQNKPDDAAFILSKLPVNSIYYGEAQVRLALYQKYKGQFDDAINTVRMAFIQRPDELVIYKNYADFMIESKRYVETVALLEKGIKLFPNDEDLRLKMAYLHYRLSNQKAFKKQIFAALKINPDSANAYSMLAELWYLKNKNPSEAIYFIKQAIALKSTNKNIKPLLAWALMQQNNSTEAVALFEEFYEENPQESFFVRSLSQVYSQGDITQKSADLAVAATVLESSDSLKSRFLFKQQTQQVQDDDFMKTRTRLPASLENK